MSKLRLLFVLDAQPEAAELAPVIAECRRRADRIEPIVCVTDRDGEPGSLARDRGAVRADVNLEVRAARQTLAELTSRCLEQIDAVLTDRRPDAVVVQGETALALAAALAAFYRRVPVAHFEVGPGGSSVEDVLPEQSGRRVVSLLGNMHFTPSGQAAESIVETLLEALSHPTPAGDISRPTALDEQSEAAMDGRAAASQQEPPPALNIARLRELLGEAACRQLGLFPLPPDLVLSVVIPIYNERDTLPEILRQIRAVPIPKEIILVDDGSTDGTRKLLATLAHEPDLRVFYHERNRGKGAALRTGFAHVRGDIVVIQDADLEYSPSQYPQLIQPIVEGTADVVYGSRFLAGGPHRVLYFWHSVANRVLTTLSNMFTDLNLTDMETCYKVFRREVIEAIRPSLKQDRFGIEPELTAKVARRKYRIFEIGIRYTGRTYEEGKKIGLRDAFEALWCTVRYWLWD